MNHFKTHNNSLLNSLYFALKSFFLNDPHRNLYLGVGLADVLANYLVVSAYEYTNIISIMLIDCFTLPVILFLSTFYLKHTYSWRHYCGVFISFIGIVILGLNDYFTSDSNSEVPLRSKLFGDLLCVFGATFYALSNVGQEYLIKTCQISIKKNQLPYETDIDQDNPGFQSNSQSSFDIMHNEPQDDHRGVSLITGDNSIIRDPLEENQDIETPYTIRKQFLARLGTISTFWTIVFIFSFELPQISKLFSSTNPNVGFAWLFLLTFAFSMFIIYTSVPWIIQYTSAATFNMSLLTSDVYGLLVGIFLFQESFSFLYPIAYCLVIIGLLVFHSSK